MVAYQTHPPDTPNGVACFGPALDRGLSAVDRMNRVSTKEGAMAARPKTQKTLEDLFYETLKDIHFAEKQILRALPKMAKAADSEDLRKAFETHRDETEGQIERLVQILELIEKPARTKTCDAVLGIVEEGRSE